MNELFAEKVETGGSPLNQVLSAEEKEILNSNTSTVNYEAGTTILKQGTFNTQVLFIKKGLVKKLIEGKHERNTIVKMIEANHFIALPIIGDQQVYPYSVVALSPCEICCIRKDAMQRIFTHNPDANHSLLNWLAIDSRFLYQKLSAISTLNSHGKLATALLYLSGDTFTSNLLPYISRKDIAELASISLESSNKIISQLKHDKIIDVKNNSIEILRRDLIEQLSTIG